jgi:hypothetical protein
MPASISTANGRLRPRLSRPNRCLIWPSAKGSTTWWDYKPAGPDQPPRRAPPFPTAGLRDAEPDPYEREFPSCRESARIARSSGRQSCVSHEEHIPEEIGYYRAKSFRRASPRGRLRKKRISPGQSSPLRRIWQEVEAPQSLAFFRHRFGKCERSPSPGRKARCLSVRPEKTDAQYNNSIVAVFLKRFQAGIGHMFEKFDSGEGTAFEHTSCS